MQGFRMALGFALLGWIVGLLIGISRTLNDILLALGAS